MLSIVVHLVSYRLVSNSICWEVVFYTGLRLIVWIKVNYFRNVVRFKFWLICLIFYLWSGFPFGKSLTYMN